MQPKHQQNQGNPAPTATLTETNKSAPAWKTDRMPDLSMRTLGRTGLEVTTLGFGAMELRGPPNGPTISDEDAGRLLNAVLDDGINFIDTSIDYGRSEELIGKFIAHRRAEYVLASKCGCVPGARDGHRARAHRREHPHRRRAQPAHA